ncbi:MAG: hypothetical protein Q9M91_06840 [Candidatus Dojkabacteria bacterium]|nr:hypothetical protein [Candidatus Dojkabacteria bacterium]
MERSFYKPFSSAFDDLTGDHAAKQSPILEMIKFVAVNTFLESKSRVKRLIIVSDMLHFTSQLSHYVDALNYAKFAKSNYAQTTKALLNGVDVDIYYLYGKSILHIKIEATSISGTSDVLSSGGRVNCVETVN